MAIKDVSQQVLENVVRQGTGIISTRPNARFNTGARTTIKINNQLFGFAFSVAWRITTDVTEIKTVDDYLPYEFAPRMITVEGSLSSFRIPGRGPTAEMQQASVINFPFHKYISLEVRDQATNALLFYSDKVMITTRAEEVSNDRLSTVTLNWRAIGWKDDQELVDGKDGLPVNANANFSEKENTSGGINGIVNNLNKIFR